MHSYVSLFNNKEFTMQYKQEYEYKCIEYKNSKDFNAHINIEAKQGWRVFSILFWPKWTGILFVTFERKLF